MKTAILVIILSLLNIGTMDDAATVYNFSPKNIDGKEVALQKFEGKVLLIVNTASECGYTPQYEGLQALYEKYKDEGLVVLGFPSNQFGGQAPGTDAEIKKFCTVNFSVSFPMFSKIAVKGENQIQLFHYLTTAQNPDFTGVIKWNFEKFLIGKNGKLLRRFRSPVEPLSEPITSAVEKALKS